MTWKLAATLLVLAMVPFANLNALLYGVFFPWRKSREGRAMFNLFLSFAALVDAAILYKFVPDFPGKPIVATVIYAGILLGMMRLTYALARLLPLCVNHRERAKAPRVEP